MAAIPFETRDWSLQCSLRMNFWPSICAWAGNSQSLAGNIHGMHSGDAFGKVECSTQRGAGCSLRLWCQKILQFVQQGQFKAEFKCSLHSDNLNKAALKPCISQQKSKVRRWRPLGFWCSAVKLVECLDRVFYRSPRDWIMDNKLKWAGRSAVLTSSELELMLTIAVNYP